MPSLRQILKSRRIDEKLSAKAGIPLERLRALAAGAEPTLGELRRLADALGMPMLDFTPSGNATEQQANLLFRRAPVVGKGLPRGTVTVLSRKMAASSELLKSARRPGRPWWIAHFAHDEDDLRNAERDASMFRKLFCNDDQLSPLLSLPKAVADPMGVMLFVIHHAGLDGASAWFDAIPFVFVSARFPGRMLFTLAHECGHLISHRDPAESVAVVDQAIEVEPAAALNKAVAERYADAFASALLMPRASVGIALKKVREIAKITADEIGDIEIGYLARIFGVSFWAAARRCEDLALLPRGGAASLNERLVKQYGSAEKRAEQIGLPARPRIEFPPLPQPLLASAIKRVRAGQLSVGRAASILGLSISDLMAANTPTAH